MLRTYLAATLVAVLIVSAAPAFAAPRTVAERARSARAEVAKLDARLESAAESYNEARARYRTASARTTKARTRMVKAEKRIGTLQTHLGTRAEVMYRSGTASFLEVLFGSTSFDQFARTWDILRDMSSRDARNVSEVKRLRAQVKVTSVRLAADERIAKAEYTRMKANKAAINASLKKRTALLRGLEAEIARQEATERAAARRRAEAEASSRRSSFLSWVVPGPSRAPRTEVVAIAKRYIGAPYRWAAAGPDAFDCSGFTMYVYRQVGVSLPHSSRAQINCGARVPRSKLKPGDLVFFGSPIHHVGIYVGGGSYIHAPHSGAHVRIDALDRSDYAGACRP